MKEVLGKRYFRALTDEELVRWRPDFGAYWHARNQNVGAANREMRRRAAIGGFDGVQAWLATIPAARDEMLKERAAREYVQRPEVQAGLAGMAREIEADFLFGSGLRLGEPA